MVGAPLKRIRVAYFYITNTPHSTIHIPHFTLDTPQSAVYAPPSALYALHFTLYTPHSTLHTVHFTSNTPPSSAFRSLQYTGTVVGKNVQECLSTLLHKSVPYGYSTTTPKMCVSVDKSVGDFLLFP